MSRPATLLTTSLGAVEADIHGDGIPVLILHGSPGGIDAARMMARFLPADRFRTITLSRPGYLRTPLSASDASIDREADLLAAVLDSFGIDRVGVFAWSGGGPSAYRLAVRHPDRVSSLIQVAAVSARWIAPHYSSSDAFLFGTTLGNWTVRLLALLAPGQLIRGALASEGALRGKGLDTLAASVMADAEQRKAVLDVARTMSWSGARRAGWENDVANYAAIDSLELERVRCPVLLIHGDGDTDALPLYSNTAHEAIPDSALVVMESGTHLAFYAHPDAARIQERARRWLTDHAKGTGTSRVA